MTIKCTTAQEWVDALIACGRDPWLVPGPVDRNGVPIPGEPKQWLATSCVDINEEKDPGTYPREMTEEICEILESMGRISPTLKGTA